MLAVQQKRESLGILEDIRSEKPWVMPRANRS
jgi:hypothetical protein